MGKMWIGKPYLSKRLTEIINFNESLKSIAENNDINLQYLEGKIEAYQNVLQWLKED